MIVLGLVVSVQLSEPYKENTPTVSSTLKSILSARNARNNIFIEPVIVYYRYLRAKHTVLCL